MFSSVVQLAGSGAKPKGDNSSERKEGLQQSPQIQRFEDFVWFKYQEKNNWTTLFEDTQIHQLVAFTLGFLGLSLLSLLI